MREWEWVEERRSRVPGEAVGAFLHRLREERCLLHGFAMLDEGKLAAEGYWAPYTADSLHRMYSAGKSFVSLAIGLLQEEGKLSLADPICQYFPDKCPKGGPHPWIAGMTIRQMLAMTTCHSRTTYKRYDGDWVESFFRVEPDHLPGAVFSYDTSSTHVLSALAERLSGRKLMEYLRERCFDKIGVSREAYFLCDPAGVSQGGSGLNCTLRDLLAVAQLVLEGGVYRGERLVDGAYLREAVSVQVPTRHQSAFDEQFGYGYQIWRGRHDCFYFYGIGGQLAICLPRERFILATMGNTLGNPNGIKDIFDAFFGEIYPWLGEAAKMQGPRVAAGQLRVLSLAEPQEAAEADWRDAFWQGRWYAFPGNRLGISRLRASFDGREGELYLEKEGREFVLAFGVENYVRQKFPWADASGQSGECCCQGSFLEDGTVLLRCHILGPDMALLTIVLRFLEEGVTVKFLKGADECLKNFDGMASGMCVG